MAERVIKDKYSVIYLSDYFRMNFIYEIWFKDFLYSIKDQNMKNLIENSMNINEIITEPGV